MYAGDLAACVAQAVERFDSLPPLMNVGLGHDHSVREYYEAVARTVGYRGRFVPDLSKPVGMAQKLVDVSKATAWGWRASTSLETGLAAAYRHYLTLPKAAA